MNRYLSNKLRNLSAVSILMVLYIHMFYAEGKTMPSLMDIQTFMGRGICSVAVPLFYVISGYLFFLKVPDGLSSIKGKIKKRVRTLLVPYIIANTLTFIFYILLNLIALKVSAIDNVVNFKLLSLIMNQSAWETIKLVFIDPPIAFQLWFVRDLLVVVAFSPCIWFILKTLNNAKFGKIIFSAIAISLFILCDHSSYVASFIWFSGGAFIAISKTQVLQEVTSDSASIILLILYIALSCILTLTDNENLYRYIPFIGIPAIWMTYDLIPNVNKTIAKSDFVQYTFFVYLIHEPLLNIFKKLPLLISRSESTLIISYFLTPIIFYCIACLLGRYLKRLIPNAYSIYTGGR